MKTTGQITLDGDIGKDFAVVKDEMKRLAPYSEPTNTDVLRHAVYIAARALNGGVPIDKELVGQPGA